MEQLGLGLVPIWDGGVTDGGFTHCFTEPVPRVILYSRFEKDLFERQSWKEKDLHSLPKWLQWPWLGQTKAMSPDLLPGLPHGYWGPST